MTSVNGQPSRQPNRRTTRLPGSVAEIEASPPGPEVGAFFDLDGTLIHGYSAALYFRQRLASGAMGVIDQAARFSRRAC